MLRLTPFAQTGSIGKAYGMKAIREESGQSLKDCVNGEATCSNLTVCWRLKLRNLEKLFDEFYGFLKLVLLLCAMFYIYYIKYIAV